MKKQRARFWVAFREYMEKHSAIKCIGPYDHWMKHPIGDISGVWLASTISIKKPKEEEIRVELTIKNDKSRYASLKDKKTSIEKQLGRPLDYFRENKNSNMRSMGVCKHSDFLNIELSWGEHFKWLKDNLENLGRGFGPYLQ